MRKQPVDLSTPIVHLTLKSGNAKTGPIPVSTTQSSTCAPGCAFKHNGCYAEYGPLAIHWKKVDAGRGVPWHEFCNAIDNLPEGTFWRHNQAGDLPHTDGHIDKTKAFMLAGANILKKGFTYTHHDVRKGDNHRILWTMNEFGFTVNLSADSPDKVDELAWTKLPIVTVLPADQTENTKTPQGRQIVVCPATIRDDVSCATCQLCAQRDRTSVVGFPAHGTGKGRIQKMFQLAELQPQ